MGNSPEGAANDKHCICDDPTAQYRTVAVSLLKKSSAWSALESHHGYTRQEFSFIIRYDVKMKIINFDQHRN